MKRKDSKNIDLKEFRNLFSYLIKENKVKFNFYNNSSLDLDLLQVCYNETNDTLELDFRDIMEEHTKELREIMNNKD